MPVPLGLSAPAAFGTKPAEFAGDVRDAADREKIEAASGVSGRGNCFPQPAGWPTLAPVSDENQALPTKSLASGADRCGEGA